MNLIYERGDIVFFRNVMFQDDDGKKRMDIRTAGHPFLILNDVKDFGDSCLALQITSRKLTHTKQYHLKPVSAKPKLKKDSFVNLNKVFKFNIDQNVIPCCHLKQAHLQRIYQMVRNVIY